MPEYKKRGPKQQYMPRRELHLKLSPDLFAALVQVTQDLETGYQPFIESWLREHPAIRKALAQPDKPR